MAKRVNSDDEGSLLDLVLIGLVVSVAVGGAALLITLNRS